MAKQPEIKCIGYLKHDDGTLESIEDMTPERRKEVAEMLGARMAKAFQDHYSRHPEEW